MKKLNDFKSLLKKAHPFQDAKAELPQFFQENLVDPARVIKIFSHDPYSFLRIFYFQFLKLCFECQGIDYHKKINEFMSLIEESNSLDKGYFVFRIRGEKVNICEKNMQKLLLEFMQVLSECKEPVSCSLARYPIIDKILVSFFINFLLEESIITLKEVNKEHLNKQKILDFLGEYFQINTVKFDGCFQFVDSQIYMYVQNDENIYLVYIEEGSRNSQIIDDNFMSSLYSKADEVESSHRNSQVSRCLEIGENLNSGNKTIVFDSSQIVFNIHDDRSSSTNSLMKKTTETLPGTKDKLLSTGKSETYKKSAFKELYEDVKKQNIGPIYRPDISNQFTNSKLLQEVLEPYRSSIKALKSRARAERKSKQAFLI